eukprot:TRINITY_DN88983_c1_g1_i1.p1 TRINITY_DN88983_c1_g1~~TRINITY_DN88983_c1_g1_i1.p1  ORF type:complete len:667 (-),score=68.56 TRINITY_DN88983_c1_g1_i1:61-1941(-)
MGGCFATSDTKPKSDATYGFSGNGNELDDAIQHALQGKDEDNLSMELELHFSCIDLKNMDTGSLTDSAIAVYLKSAGQYKFVGKTETITDNLNPVFVKSVTIRYLFEERQDMRIAVYDIDDFRPEASVEQKLIGYVDLHVHEIVTASDQKVVRPLVNASGGKEKLGNLIITAEEKKRGSKDTYKILFEAENFAPEYIFYRLNRQKPTGEFIPIIESETSKKEKGKTKHLFKEIEVHSYALVQDDESRKAMAEVFQWSSSGSHTSLGKKEFVIAELMERTELKFPTGVLRPLHCEKREQHTFLDYITNGLEIALIVAIDFTGSNGDPSEPSSLHYFDLSQNQYLQAITNVGQILENYDSDKKFSVLGFGANIPEFMPTTSHCFAVNGNIFDPEVPTLQGVTEAYKKAIKHLSFGGPTYFSSIINYVNRMVEYETILKKQNKYYTLLIMTDGIIDDMQKTIDEIVRASSLPISIIIVGIGNANFSSMEILDADEKPLFSTKLNKKMERDIVQFVPFSQYKHDPVKLAKETLEEVPRQLVSYMNSKGVPAKKELLANIGESANFFEEDRRLFVEQLINMGYPKEKIEVILNKGLPTASMDLFVSQADKAGAYVNVLAPQLIRSQFTTFS